MKQFPHIILWAHLVLLMSTSIAFSQANMDEMQNTLDTQESNFMQLDDQVMELVDIIQMSNNELDTKGDEIKQLNRDLLATTKFAEKILMQMENEMDSFEAACHQLLEEKCPAREKDFEKYIMRIEPLVETAREAMEELSFIDNAYNEKELLKTFQRVRKTCEKVEAEVNDLRERLEELEGDCVD